MCRRGKRGAVLIVDDNLRVLHLLNDIVEEQDYEVTCCQTGEKALKVMERQHFDLIFLDLALPGMSGVEVFRFMKDKGEGTAVAIITGSGDDKLALEAKGLGPMFFIRKPFKITDIREVLKTINGCNRHILGSKSDEE